MTKEQFDIQLPSGRWARYQLLETSEIENNEKVAAQTAEKDVSAVEYNATVERFGLQQMVLAHTGKIAKGTRPKPEEWTTPKGNELVAAWPFNAKDTAMLKGVYRSEHVALKDELEAIMAGKVAVLDE